MGDYFRFRVQLVDAKPPVFRTFLLRTTATFHDLHRAIQDACGWQDCHLFCFRSPRGESLAGIPSDEGWGSPDPDAKKVKLTSWFATEGSRRCVYEYDFGDSWMHDVELEAIEQHDGTWKRRLLDGARSFPLEDSGGIGGYRDCVKIARSGKGDAERVEWVGDWDPEYFDRTAIKRSFDR